MAPRRRPSQICGNVHVNTTERVLVMNTETVEPAGAANQSTLCWDDPAPNGSRVYSMAFGYLGDGREPTAAIQWGDGPDDPDKGLVMVPFSVLLGAVTEGWTDDA